MSSQTFVMSHRPLRWLVTALVIGLALVMVACGTGPQAGPSPTATPKPTATATPTPPPCSTWRIVPSPNQTQYDESTLNAVSAPSSSVAWAMGGSITDGIAEQSLIEQWNGGAWHIIANPSRISFSSMVAVSPDDVWAAGYNRTPRAEFTFVSQFEHWNGTRWSTVPSPNSNRPNNFVLGMAAVSANDVWAVGKDLSTNTGLPLTERWDGTSWQIVASPALPSGAFGSKLNGVVALSPTDAWAVGEYSASDHTIRTLIAHWNGSVWQVVASPDTWGSLASVAAAGPHDVRAVGHMAIGDGNNQHALIEQWDGTSWHTLRGPEPGAAGYSNLSGITTDGAGSYWVVGSYRIADGGGRTLTLHCP